MNTRFVCLCLGLGVLPFAAGCVEVPLAAATSSDEKSKTDPPPSEGAKPVKKPPAEVPDLPANDPLVANAVLAREQVMAAEEELLARLDDLRATLTAAKADPERLRESVEQFLELTKEVRGKTRQAAEALAVVTDKTTELSRSSRHLGASYRALADLYRRKARDYAEPRLRERLLGFAKDYDAVAASMPERCRTLDAFQKKLPALGRKVKEVNAFLDDATAYLSTHPGVGTDLKERYSPEFASLAVTFTDWLRLLDELRTALREGAISAAIQDAHRREVAVLKQAEEARQNALARAEREKQAELGRTERANRDEPAKRSSEPERAADPRVATATPGTAVPTVCQPPVIYYSPAVCPPPPCPQPVIYYPAACPQPVVYYQPPVCRGRVVFARRCPF